MRLTVRDTGPGIAPQNIERLFDPFFSTKTTAEGSGLGLAIVRRIVTNHGGTITIASTLGEGTRVDVYLPRLTQEVRTWEACHKPDRTSCSDRLELWYDASPLASA